MKISAHKVFKPFLKVSFLLLIFLSLVSIQLLYANNATTLNQTINEGTLSVDIVDAAGDPVASPSVIFGAVSFSFSAQDATGTLGTATEKIRLSNPTASETWSVNMAATGGADTLWTDSTYTYPFDSTGGADSGRLTVDPSVGTITAIGSGCTNTNVTKGASDYFLSGTTDSIDLMNAVAGADIDCQWDLTGVSLSQRLPAGQEPSTTYSIGMTITAT